MYDTNGKAWMSHSDLRVFEGIDTGVEHSHPGLMSGPNTCSQMIIHHSWTGLTTITTQLCLLRFSSSSRCAPEKTSGTLLEVLRVEDVQRKFIPSIQALCSDDCLLSHKTLWSSLITLNQDLIAYCKGELNSPWP
jgi:hypothetical protein